MMIFKAGLIAAVALLADVGQTWQLPGLVPKNYEKGQVIDI